MDVRRTRSARSARASRPVTRWRVAAAGVLALAVAGCGDDGICDAAELAAALEAAGPGSVVEVGECRLVGAFVVPAGVTLRGQGSGSVLENPLDEAVGRSRRAVVTLTPGDPVTRLASVDVASRGYVGVLALGRGSGDVAIESVSIDAQLGVGCAADRVGAVTLRDVRVRGPAPPGTPIDLARPTPLDTATHGLVVVRATRAELVNVEAHGFASIGAVLVETDATWTDGAARDNGGAQLVVSGGRTRLQRVRLVDALETSGLAYAYAGLFVGAADVTSDALEASRSPQYGLVQLDASVAHHTDLVASDNGNVGVWAQGAAGLVLDGAATTLARNHIAAVLAIDSRNVSVHDATISDTQLAPLLGVLPAATMGDGLQVVRGFDGLDVRNVTFVRNERAGILLDGGGAILTGRHFDTVVVDATSASATTALGAVMQNGTAPPGWDTGVTRVGETVMRDAAFTGGLRVVSPTPGTEAPGVPDLAGVVGGGLAGIVTPCM